MHAPWNTKTPSGQRKIGAGNCGPGTGNEGDARPARSRSARHLVAAISVAGSVQIAYRYGTRSNVRRGYTERMERIAIYGKGGVGKSVVATNLSVCYATSGKRVLHVGCD